MTTLRNSEQTADLNGISIAEAANIVGVSTTTVRKCIARGKLKAEKDADGIWVVDPQSAEELKEYYERRSECVDASEVSRRLGINIRKLYFMFNRGDIKAERLGTKWIVHPSAIEAYQAEAARKAAENPPPLGIKDGEIPIEDAMKRLGISHNRIAYLIKYNKIKGRKIRAVDSHKVWQYVVDAADLDRFIAQRNRRKKNPTTADAATLLGVSKGAVCKLIAQGKLKAERIGGKWVIDSKSLKKLAQRGDNNGQESTRK